MNIELEELNNYVGDDINCPFCLKLISNIEMNKPSPCSHTLFIAHDLGFMYCDIRTKKNLSIPNFDDPNEYIDKYENVDDMTSKITIPKSKKIAAYAPAPSFAGSFFGFVI